MLTLIGGLQGHLIPQSIHLKLSEKLSNIWGQAYIAPKINEACIAHFYALHKMNISYYGGKSTIIPLPLNVFIKMMEDSYNLNYIPEPKHIQRIFEKSNELANSTDNEIDWYSGITEFALNSFH